MALLANFILWILFLHEALAASAAGTASVTTASRTSKPDARYADAYKASPTTIKISKIEKSADLLPENTFSLGYSNKFLYGGIGHHGGHGFGGHFHHHHQGFGHYDLGGRPFGYFHPYYSGYHRPYFGHHFQYQHGYNYLHGGYPRYIFSGLHHGYF